MGYKYLSKLRPVSLGTYPTPNGNQITEIANFGQRVSVNGTSCWGWVEYAFRLPKEMIKKYDLEEVPIHDIKEMQKTD